VQVTAHRTLLKLSPGNQFRHLAGMFPLTISLWCLSDAVSA
jgi:hypothetical protein